MTIIKRQPLYNQVAQKILEQYCMDEQVRTLPSEGQLSLTLGISKNTVREALAELSAQKIIAKVHGVGNVVMHSALKMNFRIDSDADFLDILAKAGYEPEIIHTHVRKMEHKPNGGFIPGGPYLFYSELIMASGTAACQSDIFLPFNSNRPFNIDMAAAAKPDMFEFIKEYTGEKVVHSTVRMFPCRCTKELAHVFGLKNNVSLLKWDEIYYSLQDAPLFYVVVSFNPTIFCPSMLRGDFAGNPHQNKIRCTVVDSFAGDMTK